MYRQSKFHLVVKLSATRMPPLRHKVGETFDIAASEVCDWLVGEIAADPEFRHLVFDSAKDSGAIAYDAGSGTWKGVGA